MFLVRLTMHAAILGAVALAWIATPGGAAAGGTSTAPAAAPAAGVPAKAPEVSTVGITPAVLTAAERLKLAQARAAVPAKPKRIVPPALLLSIPPFETRVPATGPRDRTKPIQTAGEIAEREKGAGR